METKKTFIFVISGLILMLAVPAWAVYEAVIETLQSDTTLIKPKANEMSSCDGDDSDYFPYRMNDLDVWVHNNNTDMEYYGGRVDANFLSKDVALSKCSNYAYLIASQNNFKDWSYFCCTVTSSSSCVTKVRY